MINRWRLSGIVALVIAAGAAAVWAGMEYSEKCSHPECGFKGDLSIGGLHVVNIVSGYCTDCGQFVKLEWRRSGEEPADKKNRPASQPSTQPVGKIYVPATGETSLLYACPKCGKPFLPITRKPTICPKCGKGKLETTNEEIVD